MPGAAQFDWLYVAFDLQGAKHGKVQHRASL